MFKGGSKNNLCSSTKLCNSTTVCCQQNTGCNQCVVPCPVNPQPPTNCLSGFVSYNSPTNCAVYFCNENYNSIVASDNAAVQQALSAVGR